MQCTSAVLAHREAPGSLLQVTANQYFSEHAVANSGQRRSVSLCALGEECGWETEG